MGILFALLPALLARAPEHAQHAELDLLRPHEGSAKVYVQATMPDGEPALFMVDTGAGVSILSKGLATRLDLTLETPRGFITGLGGESPLTRTVLPYLELGGQRVEDLTVAVGVAGMPSHAGLMPLDGILGNDIWEDFVLVVDYPASVLELHAPGTYAMPDTSIAMSTEGAFPRVQTTLTAPTDGEPIVRKIWLEVDTGAHGVLLSGPTGLGFEAVASEGVEIIYGVGAGPHVPASHFYRTTRRIPLDSVRIGEVEITSAGPATWINYGGGARIGPDGLAGLLGHDVLGEHRVVFDYPGDRFAMTESERPPRMLNGHEVLLAQDRAAFGRSRDRGYLRARLLIGLGENQQASAELSRYLRRHPEDREARVLEARLLRSTGDLEAYRQRIVELGPAALVELGEIVGAVNLELRHGNPGAARAFAEGAVAAAPEADDAQIALADVLLHEGDLGAARRALGTAVELQGNPDSQLLRRARVALAEGDPVAALALLRTRVRLYPSEGDTFWFYGLAASQLQEPLALDTFRVDLEHALERLHPDVQPLDFAAAAYALLGEADRARELMERGMDRDCKDLEGPSADNCIAWYQAMAGAELTTALARSQAAVEAEPARAEFQDTLAVVHLARGEPEQARLPASTAAWLRPDDIYHLWQADRIGREEGGRGY